MLLQNLLDQIDNSARLHCREATYGEHNHEQLLCEVMSMANSAFQGSRYILFGVRLRRDKTPEVIGLAEGAVVELQGYAGLVTQYIEPEIKLELVYGEIGGKLLAAIEINQFDNPPYVCKIDATRDLRRGDCWVREGGIFRPAQRADLDRMYGRGSARPRTRAVVQVGFNGNPDSAILELHVPDVSMPPSRVASRKLKHAIAAKKDAQEVLSEDDSAIERLVHARLYGSEVPYAPEGIDTLVEGYNRIDEDFRHEDEYFFFEAQAAKFNLCLYNRSEDVLEDASLVLTLPRVEKFQVAKQLYPSPDRPTTKHELDLMGYPKVQYFKEAVRITQELGDVFPKTPTEAFETELRLAVTPQLEGEEVTLRYVVNARNLEQPQQGRLQLAFRSDQAAS